MLSLALTVAFALVGAAFALSFLRLLKGLDATDRILALDTLYINAIAGFAGDEQAPEAGTEWRAGARSIAVFRGSSSITRSARPRHRGHDLNDFAIWLGIALCLSQLAMFFGQSGQLSCRQTGCCLGRTPAGADQGAFQ